MEQVLQFLRDLSENNNRLWFQENQERYRQSREKMLFVTDLLISEISKFDPEIPLMDPKDCMFRIFRDIRFSPDKRPYKTNFGSFISKGGRKSIYAGYYFHIEPGGSFAGGGVYMPQGGPLKAIRLHLEQHSTDFFEIVNDPEFKAVYPQMMDHRLKTAPMGFAKDHPLIDLLRYKSFVFSRDIGDEVFLNGDFIGQAVEAFRQLQPVNQFLNEALDKF